MKLPKQSPPIRRSLHQPKGFISPKISTSEGIQPAGFCGSTWNEPWVPDGFGKADFNPACKKHDGCYGECEDKQGCDDVFYDDLTFACDQAYPSNWDIIQWAACKGVANLYYEAVDELGDSAYNASCSI